MHHYAAFGLNIDASIRLPALFERDVGEADVVIRPGSLEKPHENEFTNHRFVQASASEIYIFWNHIGAVCVRDGREIIYDPLPETEKENVALVIAGVALGAIMYQRGFLTLHASALDIGGGAVAFAGPKGFGKSTTAAALHAHGHPLVADDVLAVDSKISGNGVTAIPGFPQLKLWPDALEASLGDDPETLPRLVSTHSKRARFVKDNFRREPLPLRAIYVLDYISPDENEAPVTTKVLPPQEAFKHLVGHSYTVAFIGNDAASPEHLRSCAQIVKQIPVRRLVRKPSLKHLPAIVELIEEQNAPSSASTPREGVRAPAERVA